jgi:membrane-bound serine protease (ClpP class)
LDDYFGSIDWAETVAYIPREALSGASIIALGCKRIVLSPTARFGDAGPIFLAHDGAYRYVPEKVRSDMAQRMRQLADAHNRPATLAEAFVDSDLQVFEMRHEATGEVRYLAEREIAALDGADSWEKVRPVVESGNGRFLEVNGKRAVELHLAEGLADDIDDLLKQLNVSEPPLRYQPGALELVIRVLNNPFITGVLFVLGLIALYIELSAPGISVGGAIAALCFSLFFWSRMLGGTAGWLELILFFAGVGFLLMEVFVIPGFGVAGLAGLALMVVSLILASQEFLVPQTPRDRERLVVSLTVITGSGFLALGAVVVLARQFGKVPVLNKLVLKAPVPAGDDAAARKDDGIQYPVSVGDIGVAESPLRPAGKAVFGDNYVDVVADGSFVDSGKPVKVVATRGRSIVVRELVEKPVLQQEA